MKGSCNSLEGLLVLLYVWLAYSFKKQLLLRFNGLTAAPLSNLLADEKQIKKNFKKRQRKVNLKNVFLGRYTHFKVVHLKAIYCTSFILTGS